MEKCWECEKTDVPLHNHHPVPRSRGGTKIIPLCEECHAKAHHRKKNMNTSALTKEGFRRKREREPEWVPGNPNWKKTIHRAWSARREQADARALALAPVIDELRKAGIITQTGMTEALNARGVPTATGKTWQQPTVRLLLKRLERIQNDE